MEFFEEENQMPSLGFGLDFKGNIGGQSWDEINKQMKKTLHVMNSPDEVDTQEKLKRPTSSRSSSRNVTSMTSLKKTPRSETTKHPSIKPIETKSAQKKGLLRKGSNCENYLSNPSKKPLILDLPEKKNSLEADIKKKEVIVNCISKENTSTKFICQFIEKQRKKIQRKKSYSYSVYIALSKKNKEKKGFRSQTVSKLKKRPQICQENIKIYTKQTLQQIKKIHSKPLHKVRKPSPPLKPLKCAINNIQEKGKNVLNVVQLKPKKHLIL